MWEGEQRKMSSIVVSGYYGFRNAGDEAMLAAMIEVLSDLDPKLNITVISANPEDTKRRHGVHAVYWLNYWQIAKVIRKSDLVISGGGSLLQDVTSVRSIYYYMSILFLAKMLGKPTMLYAQGIGPICGSFARKAMRWLGNKIDLITVRDEGSLEELDNLGVKKTPIRVTADPVLGIHPVDRQIGRKILRRYGIEGAKPLVGISVREWRDWSHYKDIISTVTARIVDELGARVVYLPMQYPEDVEVAKKIAVDMPKSIVLLDEEYTTSELLSLVGNLDLLIGIRLHALIFAGVMGIPMIGMSYDPKIDRFLKSMGDESVSDLQNVTVEKLMEKIHQEWQEKDSFAKTVEPVISKLRRDAFVNAELALELISRGKTKR